MHPILFRIGSFEFGTYGVLLVLGFFAALGLARRMARRDGLAPEAISELAIAMLLGGVVGSKLLMVVVDLVRGVPPGEIFSLAYLRAGGAVHGGVILGAVVFFWRIRRMQLPLGQTMDAFAPAIPLGQAIGRLGCLVAGCCYGTECHQPWAITFHSSDAARISGTPLSLPLHPVQLYNGLSNACIAVVILLLARRRRFPAQLMAAYFLLEGAGRVLLEGFRGDLDRGQGWLGWAWLSTGRITGLLFVAFGAALWILFSRRAAKVAA